MDERGRIIDFLCEAGMLARVPRSGFAQLGGYRQSVAEHSHRMGVIGMALAWRAGADAGRVAQLCLVHDLPEARTLDLHHLAKRYVRVDEGRPGVSRIAAAHARASSVRSRASVRSTHDPALVFPISISSRKHSNSGAG